MNAFNSPTSQPGVSPSAPAPESAPKPILSKPRFSPLVLGAAALGILLVGGVGATAGAYSRFAATQIIAPNVFVAGVPVGGLSVKEAREKLRARFGDLQVKLQTEKRPFSLKLRELGGAPSIEAALAKAYSVGRDGNAISNFVDVYGSKSSGTRLGLPVAWNKGQLVAKLKSVNENFATPPVDARLETQGGVLVTVPEKSGLGLNIGETARLVQAKYYVGAREIAGATQAVEAKIKAADLEGRDVKLGEYTTSFNPGLRGRTTNLRISCAAIENQVLMPGEEFSFNQSTGQRTWEKGYRMANIFERKPGAEKSEVVEGLAGGICQTSSTLYNAVRKANLRFENNPFQITQRESHSLPVTYVSPGFDATVAWPYKDFKFKNVSNFPVFVQTQIARRTMTVSVWARVPNGQNLS